jgi:hypothetical protein
MVIQCIAHPFVSARNTFRLCWLKPAGRLHCGGWR